MRQIICTMAGLWLALATASLAQSAAEHPVVVELYTSQGCSSCPPADGLFDMLAERADVIPLALHVDYWDYIGWKDTFGSKANSDRQRAYARATGARTVYTPQMIVGGMDHLVGVRQAALEKLIARHLADPGTVALDLGRAAGKLTVTARASAAMPVGAVVQLVRYRPSREVSIGRGENAGRTIVYRNIVTEWRAVADWDGETELSLSLDAPGGDPVVVIVQEEGPGPILAAAVLR